MDCRYEPNCPYSAKKLYLGRLNDGKTDWPLNVITFDFSEKGVTKALQDGPYGCCVYECDNDVVDNQVVNMFFQGGKTASFTMTAFTYAGNRPSDRKTGIFGTQGEIYGDGTKIQITDFLTGQTEVIDTSRSDGGTLSGHGGGDYGLMSSFIDAVGNNDLSRLLSDLTKLWNRI